jgi:hypothetical protein
MQTASCSRGLETRVEKEFRYQSVCKLNKSLAISYKASLKTIK